MKVEYAKRVLTGKIPWPSAELVHEARRVIAKQEKQMKFEIGQMVLHPVFGAGKVTGIKSRGDILPALITVEFGQTMITTDEDGNRVVIDPASCVFQDCTEVLTEAA